MTARHSRRDAMARRSRRLVALERSELRGHVSEPRAAAAGATSAPIKLEDQETRRLIDEAIAKRRSTP